MLVLDRRIPNCQSWIHLPHVGCRYAPLLHHVRTDSRCDGSERRDRSSAILVPVFVRHHIVRQHPAKYPLYTPCLLT